jgi:hypothetical protein
MANDSNTPRSTDSSGEVKRRYNASKLVPRVEFGRPAETPQPAAQQAPQEPDLVAPGGSDPFPADQWGGDGRLAGIPSNQRPLGGGREFAGGRVRVYGCSPGCLMISLAVSLILTLLLNAIF